VEVRCVKIVLIYPRFHSPLASGLEEPLGILSVSSVLREAGHDLTFFDLTFERNLDVMDEALKAADWIGMSASSAIFGMATGVLGYVKRVAPGVPTVIGGPHATVATEDALRAGFDYAVLGEAEGSVTEFCDLLARERPHETPGIAWLDGDTLRVNGREGFIEDLDTIPFPARDLIDYSHYPTIGMMASRGCPFHCVYCQPTIDRLFGEKMRHRSPGNVVDEIEQALTVAGGKDVYFKDDTLTVLSEEWFTEFGDELRRRGLSVSWEANSRVDTVTYGKLKLMRDSGCRQICFGVESGSPDVLKFYGKRADPEQAERVFRWCHELGILPHAFLMLGAPDETVEDLRMTYDLVKRIKPRSWSVHTTTPLPGTELYEYASERGLLNVTDYEDYDNSRNSLEGRIPMRLRNVSQEDVARYRDKINHYLFLINVLNPQVIRKALRRPGAAVRKLRKVL
jgi:anaerobic magnesium-protoporphyrin IX monomethyl ester cyclase